jgi:pimeloyl-ACP methyl ester carboxylesterase
VRLRLAALALLLAGGCRTPADAERVAAPATAQPVATSEPAIVTSAAPIASAQPEPQPAGLAALEAPSEYVSLDVSGFRPAVVSVPLGAREPRPLVVALHGNFDRPEWQCEVWRAATAGYPFILCPRGIPRRDVPKSADRWEYGSALQTERELDAGVAALRERYATHLADGPIVYVGFSLGAILGTTIVRKAPERYPRVVLIEGGLGGMEAGLARQYEEKGGERVLLACGQADCLQKSRALAKRLEKLGLSARVVDGGRIGHTYDGAIAEGIAREWPWLVEGLPAWSGVQAKGL